MRWQIFLLAVWPAAALSQNPCQPLQGTAAHATCLNGQLGRSLDADLRALEDQGAGLPAVAPELNLNARGGPPVPAYDPDFSRSQAVQRQRLEQSTQSRSRALSGRVNRALTPSLGN